MKQIQTTQRRRKWAESRQAVMKGKPLGYPAAARDKYQKALDKLVAPMLRDYMRELRVIVKEAADPTMGAAITLDANKGSKARIRLNKLAQKWQPRFNYASSRIVDNMIGNVDRQSKSSLTSSLEQLSGGLTIKVPDMPAALQDSVTASIAENVALIKSVQQQYHQRITNAVLRSIQSGGMGEQAIFDELEHIGGLTEKRVKLIARDQTNKITAQMNAERQKSVGIKKFQWLHSGGGAEPRKLHLELNGKIFSYDDLPVIDARTGERGLPGTLINCHPGSIKVHGANGCMKLYRRSYAGELLSLVTLDGVVVEATPNHPILTDNGWKAFKDVDLGDYLVKGSYEALNIGKADVQHRIPTFDELFDAARECFVVRQESAGGSAFEFHGDMADGDIDVIDIGSYLPQGVKPELRKEVVELVFALADSAGYATVRCGSGSPQQLVAATLCSPKRDIGGLCSLLSLLRSAPGGAYSCRDTLASDLYTLINQDASDRSSAALILFGELKLAHTETVFDGNLFAGKLLAIAALWDSSGNRETPVAELLGEIVRMDAELARNGSDGVNAVKHLDRVVKKGVREYSAHVYNLESSHNWYVANGIVSHNCKCQAIPIIDFGDGEDDDDEDFPEIEVF